jgi:hypothetical protein
MTTATVAPASSTSSTSSPPASGRLPAWPSGLAVLSLLLLLFGARLAAEPSFPLRVGSVVVAIVGAVGRRPPAAGADLLGVRALQGRALVAHLVLAGGEALLGLHARAATAGGLGADAANVTLSLGLLLVVGAAAVLVLLELLMAQARLSGVVEVARVERATQTAVTLLGAAGFLIGSVFAVHKADVRVELASAAPTTPSGATLALLSTSSCGAAGDKPEIFLFFERGSSALVEVQDYFDVLGAGGARVRTLDQALDPALAKALKVTKNGNIAVRCGERSESWLLGADRDEAQRKLGKLDSEVRARIGKVGRDPVNVYFTVGHGERSADESDKSGRASGKGLKKLLEARNAKVKKLGLAEGLANRVPDDAGLVIVFGPTQAFLPEEVKALTSFVDAGGALAVFVDPPAPDAAQVTDSLAVTASLQPLFTALGVALGDAEVVNDREYVKQSGTAADHVFVFSTSFGTHRAVKTLNGSRGTRPLLFLQAQAVRRVDGASGAAGDGGPKVALIARSRPASWQDTVRDRRFDEAAGEKRDILDLAAVVEKKVGDKEARALVVGDADVVGDALLAQEANAIFAWEALQWLVRDDDAPAGGVTIDEDIPIRHTRDEDTAVFYSTVFGAPALLVAVGWFTVRRRRRPRPKAPSPPAAANAGGTP